MSFPMIVASTCTDMRHLPVTKDDPDPSLASSSSPDVVAPPGNERSPPDPVEDSD